MNFIRLARPAITQWSFCRTDLPKYHHYATTTTSSLMVFFLGRMETLVVSRRLEGFGVLESSKVHAEHDARDDGKANRKGVVTGVTEFVHDQVHALHLTPCVVCGRAVGHAAGVSFRSAVRLVEFQFCLAKKKNELSVKIMRNKHPGIRDLPQ